MSPPVSAPSHVSTNVCGVSNCSPVLRTAATVSNRKAPEINGAAARHARFGPIAGDYDTGH